MFVRDKMTPNPITVGEELNILEALKLMQENRIRRLPVTRGEKLVGIVTQLDLYRVAPSPATTLSVFELNYLLSRMTVREVMTRKVITVSPEATIEEAALLMREHHIGGLPVVQEGRVVGIITETDLFNALIELMGLDRAGTRLTLEVEDKPGMLAELTGVVRDQGINIISLATFRTAPGRAGIVLRLDVKNAEALAAELVRHGVKVVHQVAL
ncbi:MAG: CBS and ACT domain-containing protein [Bacillota bacterium]|nr:CBS and ACT domain-containing protein [Bacillota bacterium]